MHPVDYHTHTCCSMDSEEALEREVQQAISTGLKELCSTDHCDLLQESGQRLTELDWTPILSQFEQAQSRLGHQISLRLGIELGCPHVDPTCARNILAGAPLDFVIGSVHNQSPALGGIDFYFLKYETQQDCYRALDDYFASMAQVVALPDCYDVLGHIIYPLRYMKGVSGPPISLARYEDTLREIFTAVAQSGHGIEVNTYCGRTLHEWKPVLELYRTCGGEIVTIGSDAHTAQNIGLGAKEAIQLLQETGFSYLATYLRRQTQFVKL